MENLVVIIIVILAGVYVVRVFYTQWKKGGGSSCGCSGCEIVYGSNCERQPGGRVGLTTSTGLQCPTQAGHCAFGLSEDENGFRTS